MKSFFLIRYLLAGNTTRCLCNLYRLAKHSSSKIRQHVAENPSCPKNLLALLSKDSHSDVRTAVALNLNADAKTRERLSKDKSPDVRFQIASTSYMPIAVLSELARDENPYVRARAQQTLTRIKQEKVFVLTSSIHKNSRGWCHEIA